MREFGSNTRRALAWSAAFNLFRDVLQFGTMLMLVRLVPPSAYGQFAQTSAIVFFIAVFSFQNFVAHVLQTEDAGPADFQMHFTAGTVLQGSCFLVTNAVAAVLSATESSYAVVANPIHLASFSFLLELPCDLRRKMLERKYDWRRLNILNAVGILMTSAATLALGVGGFGVYALVGPGLLQSLPFIWDLLVKEKWRPDWSWSREKFMPAWRFGVKRTGSALAIAGRNVIESTIISGALGYQLLGIFNRALGLVQLLCAKPVSILCTGVYPILPRVMLSSGNRTNVGNILFRATGWVVVPAAVVASVLAEQIVGALYGRTWLGVVPLLPWAMAYGGLLAFVQAANTLLVAGQKAGCSAISDSAMLFISVIGLWVALPQGLEAYLQFGTAAVAVLFVVISIALHRLRFITGTGWLAAVAAPAIGAILACAFASVSMPALESDGTSQSIGWTAGWVGLFAMGYLVAMRLAFKARFREMLAFLPRRSLIERLFVLGGNG